MDKSSLRTAAPVTFWLIVASVVAAGLTWLVGPDVVFERFAAAPSRLAQAPYTLLTYALLHGGVLHLAFNLLMLAFVGRLVEPMMGSRRYALLYAAGAVVAALAQAAWSSGSDVPMVGASGAISAVLGAALLLAPRQRMVLLTPFTLFIPVTLQLRTFGWLWVALQLVGLAVADPFGGGVAYMAHLGGFAAGLAFMKAVAWHVRWRRAEARKAYERRVHPVGSGPAPSAAFRTYFVTDATGRTYVFHERGVA